MPRCFKPTNKKSQKWLVILSLRLFCYSLCGICNKASFPDNVLIHLGILYPQSHFSVSKIIVVGISVEALYVNVGLWMWFVSVCLDRLHCARWSIFSLMFGYQKHFMRFVHEYQKQLIYTVPDCVIHVFLYLVSCCSRLYCGGNLRLQDSALQDHSSQC